MPEPFKLVRVPSLKTVDDFRKQLASLGVELPCEDAIVAGETSPLAQPVNAMAQASKKSLIKRIVDPYFEVEEKRICGFSEYETNPLSTGR